jgi:hypothetical protein
MKQFIDFATKNPVSTFFVVLAIFSLGAQIVYGTFGAIHGHFITNLSIDLELKRTACDCNTYQTQKRTGQFTYHELPESGIIYRQR